MYYRNETDATLVMLTLAGEQTAYEVLVTRYQKAVIASAASVTRNRFMAEDAAQETFVRAWRGWGGFRREAAEKTWLVRIAVNVCRDMLRTGWFRRLDRRVTPEALPLADTSPLPDPTLMQAVMRLPLRQREAILLRYWQGMDIPDIAIALRCSRNTVKSSLERGKRRLKDELKGWYDDD